ncbi:MAG: hypothetical protein WDM77_09550 [Steroidobacteraceae bacterium]
MLALAFDDTLPLLERLKFLCISSGNLDEFFEIRVAGLKHLQELGKNPQTPRVDGGFRSCWDGIHTRAQDLCAEQYRCLNEILLPQLSQAGISLQSRTAWTPKTRRWLEKYFENEIEPVLSPLGLIQPVRSPHPEQEPELHRASGRQGCLWPRQ